MQMLVYTFSIVSWEFSDNFIWSNIVGNEILVFIHTKEVSSTTINYKFLRNFYNIHFIFTLLVWIRLISCTSPCCLKVGGCRYKGGSSNCNLLVCQFVSFNFLLQM